jgi:hypothetical protein
VKTRPLKELLASADEMIKKSSPSAHTPSPLNKQASEVDEMVSILSSATNTVDANSITEDVLLEKVAESMNRAHAAHELDILHRFELFEKKASESGFTAEQIEEAFSKIAAAKLKKSLPLLMGMGLAKQIDKASPPVKNIVRRMIGSLNLSNSVGY